MNKTQDILNRFTMAAKAVIYNPDRAKGLLKLIETKPGAITAVHTIIQAISIKKPVPPEIAAMLSVNIYMMLGALAQDATGIEADPATMQGVMKQLVQEAKQQPQPTSPQIKSAPPAQGGLIANAMGA